MLLVAPYIAYLSAEGVHVSGVLATVTAGILVGRRSATIFGPETRLVGTAVWQLLDYLLNGLVFLLIGLELRGILSSHDGARMLGPALLISAIVIVLRIVWVYPATYVPRLFSKRLRERDPAPGVEYIGVLAWTGLRGSSRSRPHSRCR